MTLWHGVEPKGPVVVFDDDHFYMGGAIAEKLRRDGCEVTLVTPAAEVSSWTHNTLDQHAVQKQLMGLGRACCDFAQSQRDPVPMQLIYLAFIQTQVRRLTVLPQCLSPCVSLSMSFGKPAPI